MKKQKSKPSAAAWAIVLERGYSESFIAKIEKLEAQKVLKSPCRKWLDSESDLAIVALPMRSGDINIRTAYIARREELAEAIEQITSYLADYIGGGKRISWAQGGVLSTETQEIIRQTLGSLPGPYAFN